MSTKAPVIQIESISFVAAHTDPIKATVPSGFRREAGAVNVITGCFDADLSSGSCSRVLADSGMVRAMAELLRSATLVGELRIMELAIMLLLLAGMQSVRTNDLQESILTNQNREAMSGLIGDVRGECDGYISNTYRFWVRECVSNAPRLKDSRRR
jgi:hypothetical protein